MTIDDAVIDEHSRHVLVPEIGAAGLARLLDASVRIHGQDAHRAPVAELVRRSGIAVVDGAADATVLLGVAPHDDTERPALVAWGSNDRLHLLVLDGLPCPACVSPPPRAMPTAPAARFALASLATTMLLLRLVRGPAASSLVVLDLASGRLTTETQENAGCRRCADDARGGR